MKRLEMIKTWHVLYTGANGQDTWGITVRRIGNASDIEDRGYQRQYDINDYSIASDADRIAEQLDITIAELFSGRLV
jgi:hypothetical protein